MLSVCQRRHTIMAQPFLKLCPTQALTTHRSDSMRRIVPIPSPRAALYTLTTHTRTSPLRQLPACSQEPLNNTAQTWCQFPSSLAPLPSSSRGYAPNAHYLQTTPPSTVHTPPYSQSRHGIPCQSSPESLSGALRLTCSHTAAPILTPPRRPRRTLHFDQRLRTALGVPSSSSSKCGAVGACPSASWNWGPSGESPLAPRSRLGLQAAR